MSIGIDDRMNIDAFVYTHEYWFENLFIDKSILEYINPNVRSFKLMSKGIEALRYGITRVRDKEHHKKVESAA